MIAPVSVGIGYLKRQRDLIGVELNWARPQGASDDQGTIEAFYRYQVSLEFAVTWPAPKYLCKRCQIGTAKLPSLSTAGS